MKTYTQFNESNKSKITFILKQLWIYLFERENTRLFDDLLVGNLTDHEVSFSCAGFVNLDKESKRSSWHHMRFIKCQKIHTGTITDIKFLRNITISGENSQLLKNMTILAVRVDGNTVHHVINFAKPITIYDPDSTLVQLIRDIDKPKHIARFDL